MRNAALLMSALLLLLLISANFAAKTKTKSAAAHLQHEPKAAAAAAAPPPAAAAAAAPSAAEAIFDACPQGSEWIHYAGNCYRYFNYTEYWYVAQQKCQTYGGHLVSVASRLENAFVGKLTYCRSAWLGAYANDLRKLQDPSNYAWTDGSSSQYSNHNFSSIQHKHVPLIAADQLQWINKVYHEKQQFVCEVPQRNVNESCSCPSGWTNVNDFCYQMPQFKASYIEAMHYCNGRDAALASVYDEDELRIMSLLDLESFECPADAWIGLIKLNPCRADFSATSSASSCFQWYDRRSEFNNFPQWQQKQPDIGRVVNCVYLSGEKIATDVCYNRKRFVCKKPVASSVVASCQ